MAQQDATRLLARVFGPYLLLSGAAVAVRRGDLPAVLAAYERDVGLSMTAGFLVLLFGLVVVAVHNRWRSPAQIAVSLVGWLVALKGLLLLVGFTPFAQATAGLVAAPAAMLGFGLVFIALGAWLSWAGFRGASASS